MLFLNINSVSAANETFTVDQISNASGVVKSYIETNHQLPTSVSIDGKNLTMPQYLKLSTETVLNINNSSNSSVVSSSVGNAPSPRENITNGKINKTEYIAIANDVKVFIDANSRAPDYKYQTSLGPYMRYESLVYMYANILSSYNSTKVLPDYITVYKWSSVTNTSNYFLTMDQVITSSGTVKSYIETNRGLPSSVVIGGKTVSMPNFLRLVAITTSNINASLNTSIMFININNPTGPAEVVTKADVYQEEYTNIASILETFFINYGRAPNCVASDTVGGKIKYHSLIYMYAQILNSYKINEVMPDFITVHPWTVIANTGTKFITMDQISSASTIVKSYIETNRALPSSVSIAGTSVSMPRFLGLMVRYMLNNNANLNTSIVLSNLTNPTGPAEIVTKADINNTEYTNITSILETFFDNYGMAPNCVASDTVGGKIGYQSLIYMYSQLLNSYRITEEWPDFITVNPWSNYIASWNRTFISMEQVYNASSTVKAYVDVNHQLPSSVSIAGTSVSISEFLKLAARAVVNLNANLYTSLVLESVTNPISSSENCTNGAILDTEYITISTYLKALMDANTTAAIGENDTSLGTMSFETLTYIHAQILNSYVINNNTLPDYISVIPWIAVSNPNAVYNFRTQEVFNSIQAAIDDNDTLENDTISLGNATFLENVIINKAVNIQPLYVNTIVQALNQNLPVFTINTLGRGSIIQNLIINGSTGNCGVYINNSVNNTICGNSITFNGNGIFVYNGENNDIDSNKIWNNSLNGVYIYSGLNNTLSSNNITCNTNGVLVNNSLNCTIYSNMILANVIDGVNLVDSSGEVNFNQIVENGRYGLYNQGAGVVDTQNNWWGSNNPVISGVGPSDIYNNGGTLNCDKWLVMSINSTCDRSNRTGDCYNYLISVDLTHNNQGDDTSDDGTLPDGIPVNFATDLGTVVSPGYTRNGKSETVLNSNTAGLAQVSAVLDNQTLNLNLNVTSVNVMGVYNNRTNEGFATIQEALDDSDTQNGDVITLADGIYTENVVVNKKVTIMPVTPNTVTIISTDTEIGVIKVNNGGSGSTISGLTIKGSDESYGIALNCANNCTIIGNKLIDNDAGIYLKLANNNVINGNDIIDNYYGVYLYNSTGNTLSDLNLVQNYYGILSFNSNNTLTNNCNITDNWVGIYLTNSTNNNISANNVNGNWIGLYIYTSDSTAIIENIIMDNGGGISYYNSNNTVISGNNITENWIADVSEVDSTQMVMATTIYSCGPAALATVMKNMGLNATEEELAIAAGTDTTGTTLLGLVQAAQAKGLTAVGVRLTTDQLMSNYIVVLNINGNKHYNIIQNITGDMVYLIDPNLGYITLNLTKFNEIYTGDALVVNNTTEFNNTTVLTTDEMQNIKAMGKYRYVWIKKKVWIPGKHYITYKKITLIHHVIKYYFVWVKSYWKHLWGPIYVPVAGHFELRYKKIKVKSYYYKKIYHIKNGYWKTVREKILICDNYNKIRSSYDFNLSKAKKRLFEGGFGKIILGWGQAQFLKDPTGLLDIVDGGNQNLKHFDELHSVDYINPTNNYYKVGELKIYY